MNQRVMLQRILDILNQKIMMGAGRMHHRRIAHHRGGDEGGELIGGRKHRVHHRKAGVSAGRRRVHHRKHAGEGEGRRMHHKKRAGVRAGANPWISHVKAYAKKHHISYRDAMSRARASY